MALISASFSLRGCFLSWRSPSAELCKVSKVRSNTRHGESSSGNGRLPDCKLDMPIEKANKQLPNRAVRKNRTREKKRFPKRRSPNSTANRSGTCTTIRGSFDFKYAENFETPSRTAFCSRGRSSMPEIFETKPRMRSRTPMVNSVVTKVRLPLCSALLFYRRLRGTTRRNEAHVRWNRPCFMRCGLDWIL
jgi:hypothetical protein